MAPALGAAMAVSGIFAGRGARPVEPIEAAPLRKRRESVGQPNQRFRRTQHEKTIRLGRLGKAVDDADPGIPIEIDQDVPAEDHVEDPELGKVVQQIELPFRYATPRLEPFPFR